MRKVSQAQVRELLVQFYQDFHSELFFEKALAENAKLQWSRSSREERLAAKFAYDVAGKIFRKHYLKAVHARIK